MIKQFFSFISPLLLALISIQSFSEELKQENAKNPVAVIKTSHGDLFVELFVKEAPQTVNNFINLALGKKEFTNPSTGKKEKKPFYNGLIFHRIIKNFMIQGGDPKGTGRGGPGYQFEDEISAQSLGLHKIKVLTNGQPHPWLMIRSQQQFQQTITSPLLKKMGISSNAELEKRRTDVEKRLQNLTLMEAYELMGYEYNNKRGSHPPKRGSLAMANAGPNTNGSQFFINIIDTPWLTGKHTVFGQVIKGMDIIDKISQVSVGPGNKPLSPVKIINITLKN